MENTRTTEAEDEEMRKIKQQLLQFMKEEFNKLEAYNWGQNSSRKGINYEQFKDLIIRSEIPIENDEQFSSMCENLDPELTGWIEY